MNVIEIRDDAPRYRLAHSRIKKITGQILEILGWKNSFVSLWFVKDRKIRSLNKKFLGHDWATDVISFEHSFLPQSDRHRGACHSAGDLIISLDTTARQAKEYGNSFFYELCFYICHGILHVMGHDDKTPKQAAAMAKKQTAVLEKIGIRNGDTKN